jgi:hypothetical protein
VLALRGQLERRGRAVFPMPWFAVAQECAVTIGSYLAKTFTVQDPNARIRRDDNLLALASMLMGGRL